MVGHILISPANFSQFFTDTFVDDTILTANEKAIIATAAPKRRSDFSTGRYCAKKALEGYQIKGAEILRGEGKDPIWPEGFVGSISHAEGLCGAVAGRADSFVSMGLDIEKQGGVKKEMWDMVCTPHEQHLLNTTLKNQQDLFATLIFSIKESFYKFQYPLTRQFLEFTDVELNMEGAQFRLEVKKPDYSCPVNLNQLQIEWTTYAGQVISLCYLLKS